MGWEHLRDIALENDAVRLRPVRPDDLDRFRAIAFDPEIWRYFVFRIDTEEDLRRFVRDAVGDTRAGTRAVLAIVDKASGRIAGSTAFGNLAPEQRRLEIGWSWLGPEFRGTDINKWAQYLMLAHAFAASPTASISSPACGWRARARWCCAI